MNKAQSAALAAVLILVTVAAVYYTIHRMKRPKYGDFPEYPYTVYAMDEAGRIYVFRVEGKGLRWPVLYEGHVLKMLYGCQDCGHRFAVEPGVMVTSCPACGGRNVGGYAQKFHGRIEATRIKITQPRKK